MFVFRELHLYTSSGQGRVLVDCASKIETRKASPESRSFPITPKKEYIVSCRSVAPWLRVLLEISARLWLRAGDVYLIWQPQLYSCRMLDGGAIVFPIGSSKDSGAP